MPKGLILSDIREEGEGARDDLVGHLSDIRRIAGELIESVQAGEDLTGDPRARVLVNHAIEARVLHEFVGYNGHITGLARDGVH